MPAKKRWINKRFDKDDLLSQQNISWSSSDDESPPDKLKKLPKLIPSELKSEIFQRDDQAAQHDFVIGETFNSSLVNMSPLSQPSTFMNISSCNSLSPILNKKHGLNQDSCSSVRQQEPPVVNVSLFDRSPLLTKDKTTKKSSKSVFLGERSTSKRNNYHKVQIHKSPMVNGPLHDRSPVLIKNRQFEQYSRNALPISREKISLKQSSCSKVQLHNSSVISVPLCDPYEEPLLVSNQKCDSTQDSGKQICDSPLTKSPSLISSKTNKKFERNPSSDICESQQSNYSTCDQLFDENSPIRHSSPNNGLYRIDSLSQTSKETECATSSSNDLSLASSVYYVPPVRKKRYKKNGLMKVLQKVLTSQKTSLSIWHHEISLEGGEALESKEGVVRFRVQLIKREYGNTLLECSGGECSQDTLDIILVAVGAIVSMDFVIEEEYLLFPPYQCTNVVYNSKETVCYFNTSRILQK